MSLSRRIGSNVPSAVVVTAIAITRGECTTPAAYSPANTAAAPARLTNQDTPANRPARSLNNARSSSYPASRNRKPRPIDENIETGSAFAHPATDGPTRIPATKRSTT